MNAMQMMMVSPEGDHFAQFMRQRERAFAEPDATWLLVFYISDSLSLLISLIGNSFAIIRLVILFVNGQNPTFYDFAYAVFFYAMFAWKIITTINPLILVYRNERESLKSQKTYFFFSMYIGAIIDGAILILVIIVLITMSSPDYKDIIVAYLVVFLIIMLFNAASFFLAMFALLKYIESLPKAQLVPQYQPVMSYPWHSRSPY